MTGAGAPRATFRFGFRSGHSSYHSIARGVTDPGISCTDWLGIFDVPSRSLVEHLGTTDWNSQALPLRSCKVLR